MLALKCDDALLSPPSPPLSSLVRPLVASLLLAITTFAILALIVVMVIEHCYHRNSSSHSDVDLSCCMCMNSLVPPSHSIMAAMVCHPLVGLFSFVRSFVRSFVVRSFVPPSLPVALMYVTHVRVRVRVRVRVARSNDGGGATHT